MGLLYLNKILGLGGLLNGGKTLVGLMSLLLYLLQHYRPEYVPIITTIAGWLGVTLVPVGLAHKVVKEKLEEKGELPQQDTSA